MLFRSLGIDDAGVSAEGTGTSVVSVSGKVKYDLPDPIAELQDAVGLTRGTIKAILEGCSRLDEFEIDPATFLAQVGDKINRVKNDLIAQGIKYVRLPEDEWYTMRDLELDDYTAYLGQNAWKPDMTSKSLYNYVAVSYTHLSGAIQPGGTYVVENPSGDDHAFMGAAANFTQEGLGYERRPGTVTCVSHFERCV